MKYTRYLIAFIYVMSSCVKQPMACFNIFPSQADTIKVNEGYYYDAGCSTSATAWQWQFDEQMMLTQTLPSVYFAFTTSGLHTVRLTVTNQGKKANHTEKRIFVKP